MEEEILLLNQTLKTPSYARLHKYITMKNSFLTKMMILFVLGSFIQISQGILTVSVQSYPSTVQYSYATLTVYGTLGTAIASGGQIQITAPSDLNIVQVITASCTASGKIITVKVSGALQASAFQINITSCIQNPSTTNPSSTFTFSSYTSASSLIESQTSLITLTATVGSMSTFTLVPSSQVVGATTSLTVTVKANHYIPANGIIKIGFPLWNPNAATGSQLDYFQSSVSCATVSILSSSMTCSYSSQVLIVSNAVGAQIAANTQFQFTISGFMNPISTSTVSGFTITTQDSSSGNIDYYTTTLAVTTAGTITSAAVLVDTSTTSSSVQNIVQETNNLQLTFTSPVPLNANCNIQIIVPDAFDLSSMSQIVVFGMFGVLTTLTSSSYVLDQTANTISFTSCSTYSSNKQTAYITLYSVIMPQSIKQTDSFQIYITGSSGQQIGQVSSGITFTASPGTMTLTSATPAVTVVQSTTGIAFVLKPNHNLTTSSELVITFPTGYTALSTCSLTLTTIVNSAATCTGSGTTYTINNFLSSIYNSGSGSSLKFTLNSVTLPQTISTLTGLTFMTKIQDASDGLYYEVDYLSTSIPFTLTSGSVSATITPASLVTSVTTSYTILFTPDHQIPQNGYIIIQYPTQLAIADTSYSASQVSSFVNFPTTPSITISKSARTITINNGFRTASPPAAGTSYQFTVPGVTNPVTQQRTNSFSFSTFSSGGSLIDSISGGIFVTMTSASYMSSVAVTLGSYVNSAVTSYTFSLTANVAITSSNYIFISFPSDCDLPSSSTTLACTSSYTTIVKSVACAFTSKVTNGVQAIVTLVSGVSQINILQTFDIKMNGITNPNSTYPTSTFAVNITDPSYNTINSNPSSITITTNTPSTVSKASLTQNTTGAGQYSYYQILFYPLNDINIGGGVQITYPSQITLPGKITATFKSYVTTKTPVVTYDTSSRVIIITNVFTSKFVADGTYYLNITIYGFQNPIANIVTDSFIVQTFDIISSTYYYIDWAVSNMTLNSACNYPCKSCSSSSASNCTACYSTSTLNKLQDGACVSSCSLGKYYDAATGSCKSCDSTCLNCKNSSTQCVSCGVGDYLYLLGTSCLQTCPTGYIQDSKLNLCTPCTSPCGSCQNTTTTCTSCLQTTNYPYFYQDTFSCYQSCPSGVTILQNNNCIDCDSNCKTCSGSTQYCTACESYMKFDQQQHTCIQVCNKGTQIYDDQTGICDYCSSNCATCSGSVSTCTTCSSDLILTMDNICDTSCRNDSQLAVNGICQSCQLPCSKCKNSTDHCTKCAGDYLLYNTTCVQYCPLKYEANNDTGQCILVGLICPTGFTINEAGDGCIPNQIECKSGYMINTARTACIPEPGFPVPFPFLILSICFGLIVFGSHIRDRFFTKVITCLIALIGSQEMLIYILIVCYSGQLEKFPSLVLSLVGLGMLIVSNLAFFILYRREILKDVSFYKWRRLYPRTAKYLPYAALFVNFKLIKMLYSGFFGQESCLAQFDDPIKNFFKPLRMVTFFSFIFVYIPIIIADVYIFISVQWGYQLLVLAIESFILAILMMILTVIEFRNASRLIMSGDEQYVRIKPKTSDGQTNVMSGLIDMDESTLIRSKVVDDDYEVQLRKRALVSILGQVGKNFLNCQKKGVDLGGQIDYCMTKFDEEKIKLRRAFSMEKIKEEDSWMASDKEDGDDSDEDVGRQRRYSFPLTPRTMVQVQNPQFSQTLMEIKGFTRENLQDNVYAECKPQDKQKEQKKKKQISRRTQTYLRELLSIQGEDMLDSDLEIVMEDEAEMDYEYAQGLIDNVIDGLSDSESGVGKGKKGKKKKLLNGKRAKEIPDFELNDIMGEFEIDDLGNFIILRGDKGELLDKKERRVNRRGYLVDRFGNVINSKGQVIFKQVELDSDDEIPAPFGFEKRKKNLLNMNEDGEFKVEENGRKPGMMEDDEEMIDKELKLLKKGRRKKKKAKMSGEGTTGVVEEEDDEEESSIDSLMADSPGKYQLNQDDTNEDDIIDKVTRKKVPKKRGNQKETGSSIKKVSPKRGSSPQNSGRKKTQGNVPPKRINRDDTRELFPSLAIENQEQKKLYKIAESIGGLAQQFADDQQRQQIHSSGSGIGTLNNMAMSQEKLDKLKQEHFRDIMNSSQGGRIGGGGDSSKDIGNINQGVSFSNIGNRIMGDQIPSQMKQKQEQKLPPRPPLEKIYGNLGDVVSYEERQIMEQMRAQGGGASPFSSQLTSRMGGRQDHSSFGGAVGGDRRLRGLESIYLQKFDKKLAKGQGGGGRKQSKAKFRSTLNQFVDDPERLVDDGGMDFSKQNEVSLLVADKLDKLQRQYMSNTSQNRFEGYQPASGMQSTGGAFGKKPGSASGSIFQQDPSLEPVRKGNWIDKQQ